jgi:hypothetical protein
MKFADYVREDRRLQILILLEASADYGASHYLLSHALDAYGHSVSMDALKTDIAWLEEQGLVTCTKTDDAIVARLTQRGLDAAGGRVVVPGVKRPKPE